MRRSTVAAIGDRHASRLTGWTARTIWIAPCAGIAVMVLFAIVLPRDPDPVQFGTFALMIASFGLVGAMVAIRLPSNPIGWMLWAAAMLVAVAIAGSDYSGYSAYRLGAVLPGTVFVAWLSSWVFVPAIGLTMVFVPLLFPDGHLPSGRWRPVAWLAAAAVAAASLAAFRPGPLSNVQVIRNPFGVELLRPLIEAAAFPPSQPLIAAIFVALVSTLFRYRRGGEVERRQLKWFASVLVLAIAVFSFAPDQLSFPGISLLPIGIGIAVLRFRLYEIDRIISRTVSYALVTAILGAVFVGSILVLQALLAPLTSGTPIAVAASTLLVASLFQPVRRRIQGGVDRRFNRARYDAQQIAEAFAGRVRDQVDLEELGEEVETVVRRTLQPAKVGLWLREETR